MIFVYPRHEDLTDQDERKLQKIDQNCERLKVKWLFIVACFVEKGPMTAFRRRGLGE